MRIFPLYLLLASGPLLLLGCSGQEEASDPLREAEEAVQEAASDVQETVTDAQEGDISREVQAFLDQYEEFIDEYCEMTGRFARASLSEKAQLAQEAAAKGMELSEFATESMAMEAVFSRKAEERLEELHDRAEACSQRMGG